MELSPDILARAQRGDPLAQAEVLRHCVGPVRALIRRLGLQRDFEDQLQEILAHLLRVLPQFQPEGPAQLGTWVHTVTHRWLLMQRRKRHLELVPLEEATSVADAAPSAHETVERRQLGALLMRAVEQLPEAQRRVFVMAQVHLVGLQQIADAEGISVGTVKSRLHRARAELVQRLGAALDDRPKGGRHAVNE